MASTPAILGRVFATLEWRAVWLEFAAEAGLPTTTLPRWRT
jgi:hypothetical protein